MIQHSNYDAEKEKKCLQEEEDLVYQDLARLKFDLANTKIENPLRDYIPCHTITCTYVQLRHYAHRGDMKKNISSPSLAATSTAHQVGFKGDHKEKTKQKAVSSSHNTAKPHTKECDKTRVQRLLSPFGRYPYGHPVPKAQMNNTQNRNPFRPNGLSRQEKCYLLTTCQARSSRYVVLKNLVARAIKENKIFCIHGNSHPVKAVRKALVDRGWVEKIPPNRMNLAKLRNGTLSSKTEIDSELERLLLANLVEKCTPNFIWYSLDDFPSSVGVDSFAECHSIINKLRLDAQWTTKQGLCSSMKGNYWFYIEDESEVDGPRTYGTNDIAEIEDFVEDYKLTACTSLLKWILSMVANERPIFTKDGNISLNVIVFALNRCKEYLFRKQNKDIDKNIGGVSTGQWNAFLKKYYRIISKDDVFQVDKDNKLPIYLGFAKFLLKEIHRYRPQLSCEGCHNIWIIKPAHCSRGRGIRMASKLGVIMALLNKSNAKYVIQKYIEEPLLIHETKFDIRQYYLVTSTFPLIIWMYTDCYLKFSSQKYSLKNFHESIHLTNNAVQRKYDNCTGRHAELPNNNMWDLNTYKNYLNKIGKGYVWDSIIYPGMRKSIIGIMLSCQDSLSVSKNRFELYGCDFILDKEYKPWLIEINSNPDLNHTTKVTTEICPQVITDIIKVVIDRAASSKADTGKFRCIYRQPITIPRYGTATDLCVRGYALPHDYFYRGNIQLKEEYGDAEIGKQKDIKAILKKLKELYNNSDIMVQPEEDAPCEEKKEQETCTQIISSDKDLHEAAAAITNQLDVLLDRIISEHAMSTKSLPIYIKPSIGSFVSNISIAVINKTSVKSIVKHMSEGLCVEKSSVYSKLSERSVGKESMIEFNVIHFKNSQTTVSSCCTDHLPKNTILEAASKIISFLEKKEIEYKASNFQHQEYYKPKKHKIPKRC